MTDARELFPQAMHAIDLTCEKLIGEGVPPQVVTLALLQIVTIAWTRQSGEPPLEARRQLADAILRFTYDPRERSNA